MRIGNISYRKTNRYAFKLFLFIISPLFLTGCGKTEEDVKLDKFDGGRAYQDVIEQVDIGARYPGSVGHEQVLAYLHEELLQSGWVVEEQIAVIQGKEITNLIASRDDEQTYILLGAHYDNRIYADQDPVEPRRTSHVPGANDGGSGVAVLLELARTLPKLQVSIRLVFFDAEDNGGIEDFDWVMGSRAYVRDIFPLPKAAIILDMIGDADLQIYYESNSDPVIREEIWRVADGLGYEEIFIKEERHSMLDDHTPFLEAGIPAVDLIDFDYPYWHTTEDSVDKVSADSLQVIGDTITTWLLNQE